MEPRRRALRASMTVATKSCSVDTQTKRLTPIKRVDREVYPTSVHSLFWRWFHRLPSPFTAEDLPAGFVYGLAVRQFEISDTRVFDRPPAGRAFFEGLIHDHLVLGRLEQVVLVFDRMLTRRTPDKFSTKVLTKGVDPQISCTYRWSRIKQYLKEGRASALKRQPASMRRPSSRRGTRRMWSRWLR